MLHCPLKSDIKWKNPDGIFPDALDMVRPATKFKPPEDPPKKTGLELTGITQKGSGRGLTGIIDMALETTRGCRTKRWGRDRFPVERFGSLQPVRRPSGVLSIR